MGKGMRFAGIRLLISLTLRANAGKATFGGKTAGGNSSPKVGFLSPDNGGTEGGGA